MQPAKLAVRYRVSWSSQRHMSNFKNRNHCEYQKPKNYCNMTFLHGNRSCIGKGFAKAEMRLIIAKLFSIFDVKRLPGDNGKVRSS